MPLAVSRRAWPVGFVLLAVVLVGIGTRVAVPPAPLPPDAPASEFSAGRALALLRQLLGDEAPHPIGSEANERVRERIVAEFERLGLSPEIQEANVRGRASDSPLTVSNITATIEGKREGKALVVTAHYDSVASAPGAADDGSGVAAVLEIARVLAAEPTPEHSIVFLLTDGEEAGLLGAKAFAQEHRQGRRVGAVINLEARGSSGSSLMFETSGADEWLVRHLAASIGRPVMSSAFSVIYRLLPHETDLTVYKSRGIPGVNFAFIGSPLNYHTPSDKIENLAPGALQHQGENGLGLARRLAVASDLETPAPGNAVYFDVLGFGVVWWPEGWSLPLALLASLALAAAIFIILRRRALDAGALVSGLLCAAATPLLAMLLAACFGLSLMDNGGGWQRSWSAHPWPILLTFWTIGLAIPVLVGTWGAGRAGAFELWIGNWLIWACLGVVASVVAPAVSYLFIAPTLVAGLAALLRLLRPDAAGAALTLSSLGALLAGAILWLPLAWFIYDGGGVFLMPLASAQVASVVYLLAPLLSTPEKRGRWIAPALLSAVVLVSAVVSLITHT